MAIKRIPLVGDTYTRNINPMSFIGKDQQFKNCIFDSIRNPVSGQQTVFVNKRPGITSTAQTGSSSDCNLYDMMYWPAQNSGHVLLRHTTGTTFIALGTALYDGTTWTLVDSAVSKTPLEGSLSTLGISGISLAFLTTDNKAYIYDGVTTFTNISDADFPGNAGKTVFGKLTQKDGFIFVITSDGLIYNSDLNSITSWSPINFIATQAAGKTAGTVIGLGIFNSGDYLAAFTTVGIEFYVNAGNPSGSPLSLVKGMTSPLGVRDTTTLFQLESTVYFVSTVGGQTTGVYGLTGTSFTKISDQAVDALLQASTSAAVMRLRAVKIKGSTFIFLSISDTGPTRIVCVYQEDVRLWSVWDSNGSYAGAFDMIAAYFNTVHIGSKTVAATLRSMDFNSPSYSETSGSGLVVQTGPLDFGTSDRKFVSRISLIADTQASGTALLECSDNDFTSFSTLGSFDMTAQDKFLTRCGSHKGGRSYRLTHSAATPFRAEALQFEYSVGT